MKELSVFVDCRIADLHDKSLDRWYRRPPKEMNPASSLRSVILAQHFTNFKVWSFEDQARRRDMEDSYIVGVKRSIDLWNQRRNDLAEKIDEFVLSRLKERIGATAEAHSETAGMMVDRLSILSLKTRHMRTHALKKNDPALAAECSEKLKVLKQQRKDLCGHLEKLIAEFCAGRRYFKSYRQFKQYNDPRLNPLIKTRRA